MSSLFDKVKKAAVRAGEAAAKDARVKRAVGNLKETVEAFSQGYRQRMDEGQDRPLCPQCHKTLPDQARFCPHCGAKVG